MTGDELEKISIDKISGISSARLKLLNKLGIFSVSDILYYFPKSYENRTLFSKILNLNDNEETSVLATVIDIKLRRINAKLSIVNLIVEDESGIMKVTFFNQIFVTKVLELGKKFVFFGKPLWENNLFNMKSPKFEKSSNHTFSESLIPVYPLIKGLTQTLLIHAIKAALLYANEYITETLPATFRQRNNLCELLFALSNIHFPKDEINLNIARHRLAFEELFYLILGLKKLKIKHQKNSGPKFMNYKIVEEFAKYLPFELTDSQKRVVREICSDFKNGFQMNRLVQGDVGSGKTVVAAMSMLICVKSGYQSALMAPTEILAKQHYDGLKGYFEKFNVKVELLVSSISLKEKNRVIKGLKNNEIDIVIGTNAIVFDKIQFNKIGLAITDEQHRFGVKDRARLTEKGENPHTLIMTATPIPRTLALIIYADLDVSIINELPIGRVPITTKIVAQLNREKMYTFVGSELKKGHQAFVVCPLIEESENMAFDLEDTNKVYDELQNKYLANYKIGLLHGKMKAKEKDEIMLKFQHKEFDLIVSTTVIEVGVNIPEATCIVIENADRFGLASLHQLRGRVGRSDKKSYCFLTLTNVKAKKRLEILEKTTNGYKISEFDLKNRGPGEFFGTKQHGLPSMKLNGLTYNINTVNMAKKAAEELLKTDENLEKKEYALIKRQVNDIFKKKVTN